MSKEISYYIDRSKSLRKSIVVFRQIGNVSSPIMYISKPKHLSEEDFNDLFNRMQIAIKP